MDKFTPDILILGYSGQEACAPIKQKLDLFSLTGLSPSLAGLSRAVLLTIQFVTSFKFLTPTTSWLEVKNSIVLSLLPSSLISKLTKNKFRLCPFRSPLLRVSILFLFLWLLRCFTSPGILPVRQLADRIIAVYAIGFPHSDISGSKPARRLPEA